MRAGQGHRQLDQPEGGRGRLPRQGAHRAALRRRRRGDGVRRDRPGRHRRAQGRDLRARLPAAHRARSASTRRTSSSTRTSSRSPPASRSTTSYAHELHRGDALDQGDAARACKISGGVSNLSFSFRGNDVVREAMHSAFLYHAIRAGHGHGHRQRRPARRSTRRSRTELLEHVEDVLFDRRPDATERLVEFAEHGEGRGQEARARPRLARGAGRGAALARARARHRRLHRGRRRGGAPEATRARSTSSRAR